MYRGVKHRPVLEKKKPTLGLTLRVGFAYKVSA
jgi:hypothetical protein